MPFERARCAIASVAGAAVAWLVAAPPAAVAAERDARGAAAFTRWAADRRPGVDAYAAFLVERGVGDVVPLHQLLRTASTWSTPSCRAVGAEPFELPPPAAWPAIVPTLRLVAHLGREGVIDAVEVVSAYRSESVNQCAEGAPASRHRLNVALDLWPAGRRSRAEMVASLCAFHATQGARWKMGLSVYPSGRIHVDTAGWRTWGDDGKAGTSACRSGFTIGG